jgi:autotransporter-associated beta strand protein
MKNSTIQLHCFQFFAALCALLALMQPAAAAPSAYQSAVLGDTPYLYYELGEASGTTATDAGVNGYNGTYMNSPTMSSSTLGVPGDSLVGPSDTAVTFSGNTVAGSFVQCPASANGFGTSLGTSSHEFVLKTTTTSAPEFLSGQANTGSTVSIQVILNENAGGTTTANMCRVFIRGTANNLAAAFTNPALFDGNYHHLVWTYNATVAPYLAAYVDGVAQNIGTPAGTAPTAFAAFGFPLTVATYNSRGLTNDFFTGTIDEFAIYSHVLTPAQVANHYAAIGINNATWVGGTGANFSTAANWSPAALASLNTLVFTNVTTTTALNNDETAFTFTGILFTNSPSAYTITGNSFTLSGSVINYSATAAQSIANNISLTNWTAVNWSAPVSDAGGGTTLGGIISGPYGLTKSGAGTLTLSGADTYNGPTTNNAGTLAVNGSLAGNVVVNSGATLAGTGTVGGTVTINSGAILAPGNSGVGTLNFGSLTLNSGAINNFEFSGVANDKVINSGTLTVNGGAFNLYQPGGTTAFNTPGTYTLIQYAGSDPALDSTWTTASGSNPHVLNPVATYTYAFTASGGALKLTIVATAAVNHVWTNSVSGSWSQASNWSPSEPHNAGDIATLGVGLSLQTVTLDASLSVGYLGMTNANSFVIANAGNTLTLDNTNGGAKINVSGGTVNVIQAPVSLNDNATINVGTGDALALTNVLSSTSAAKTLTISGVGALTLSGANTYGPAQNTVGTTIGGAGLLQVGANTALAAGDVSVSANATLQAGAAGLGLNNNFILGSGVTFTENNNGHGFTLNGILSGGGNLTETDSAGADTLTLNGVNTYTGSTTISTGALVIGGGGQLGDGVYPGAITNNGVFNYNSTAAQTLSGIISGTGALNEVGSGTLTLTGVNSYNGNTTISAGTLTIGGTGELGSGAYAGAITNNGILNYNSTAIQLLSGGVAGSGVLNQGAGTLTLSGSDTYTGGTVVSGNGSLTFANNAGTTPATGTVTLNGFGSVAMTGALPNAAVNGTNSINGGGNSTVSVGTLALNGTVTLSVGGTGAFDLTGSITGSGTIILTNRPVSAGSGGMQLRFNGTAGDPGLILNLGTTNDVAVNNTATAITLGGLMGSQYSQLQGGTAAMTYTIGGANKNTEFDGIIANGTAGATSIAKIGTGVLNLTGANTYTGATTITNGTLLVNGSTAGSGVLVNTSGTLGGAGTIGDPTVTIGSGGHTLPGGNLGNTSGVTTTMSSNLVYNAGAEADFNLNNAYNAGNDRINVSENLNGNGTSVGIYVSNGTLDTNHDYVLFTTGGTVASGFAATPIWLGSTPANLQFFQIVTVGNTVVLHNSPITVSSATVTPNPVTRGQRVTVSVTATTGVVGGSINSVIMNASAVHAGATSVSLNSTNPPTSNTYTNSVTVDSTAVAGSYNLTVAITDSASNVRTLTIPLTINGLPQVWNGNGGDNNWSTTANWVGGQPPQAGDFATFAGINRLFPNMETGYTLSGLTFNTDAGGFDIMSSSDSTLTMSGGVTNNSLNAQTFDASVTLALNGIQTFNTASSSIAVNGVIEDGSSQGSLVKTGNGTLVFPDSRDNTYTGTTTVNGGVLSVAYDGDVFNSSSIILNGGILLGAGQADNNFGITIDPPIGIGPVSGSVGGTALIDATSGTTLDLQGVVASAGNTGANNLVVNSLPGDSGTVYMGIDGNTYNGTTVISNGLLWAAASTPLAYSTLDYSNQGGYLVIDGGISGVTLGGLEGAQNIALTNTAANGVTLTVGNNNASTIYSGNLSDPAGNGGLTKVGTGTLTLAGTDSYVLPTTISAGVLRINTNGVLNTASASVPAVAGAQLAVSGGFLTVTNTSNIGVPSGGLLVSSGSATFLGGLTTTAGTDNGYLISVTGGSLTATNLTLGRTGLNDSTQPTAGSTTDGLYINGGTVNILANLNLGTAAGANSSVNTRIDSGSLTVGGVLTIGLNNNGRWSVMDVNGGSLLVTNTTTGISVGGPLAGNAELLVRAGTATVGMISMGQTSLGSTNMAAVVNLTGGSLYVGSGGIAQVSTGALFTSTITLKGGTLGAITNWSSTNNMQLGTATIRTADTNGNPWNIALSGVLSGTNLVKTGSGTLNLSGVNTYTGTTTISNGTLALSASGSITITAQVGIGAGATFDISALPGYTFTGASPVQTLAGISTSGAGNVNVTGNTLTLASGAKGLLAAAGGASPTVGKISVAGNLALNGNLITINVTGSTLGATTNRLLDCTGILSGTANATPVITGLGLSPGATASIVTTSGSNGHVDLVVTGSVLMPTVSPHITGFNMVGGNVVINGTNGQTGGTYYLLGSTNVALPLSQWTPVATNVVSTNGPSGAFTFTGTNTVSSGAGQQFYILSNTNN